MQETILRVWKLGNVFFLEKKSEMQPQTLSSVQPFGEFRGHEI